MVVRIVQVVAALAVVGGGLWLGFAVSFRKKFRPVQSAIRRLNRRVLNPEQLRTAGRPDAWASVIHHVGRTSGTSYQTPVVAMQTEDGFVIALPYGPGADWVRHIMAAGTTTIEHEGRTVRVTGPELVPADDASPRFAAKEQRMHRVYGVDDFLLLRHAGTTQARSRAADARP